MQFNIIKEQTSDICSYWDHVNALTFHKLNKKIKLSPYFTISHNIKVVWEPSKAVRKQFTAEYFLPLVHFKAAPIYALSRAIYWLLVIITCCLI